MGRGDKKKNRTGGTGLNKKESELFLAKNKSKPSVEVTPTGLQYEVLEQESGAFVLEGATVEVQQRISLRNGTVIEDTYKKNESERFAVDEALPGYREGLLLMSVGDRFKLTLPPELAWGKRGTSSRIGPYEVLIIDCKVLAVL